MAIIGAIAQRCRVDLGVPVASAVGADDSASGRRWRRGRREEPVVNAFTARTLVGAAPELEVQRPGRKSAENSQLNGGQFRPSGPVPFRLLGRSSGFPGGPLDAASDTTDT